MHESFRPTVEQWKLFCDVRDYVVANRREFEEPQAFLARFYSLEAISARAKREDEAFLGKEMAKVHRKFPEGYRRNRRSPLNTPYTRLMQFVRDESRRDLSSLGDREREIWGRRFLYVTFLLTDPDAGERGLHPDAFLRTPWDDGPRLGRWWCREAVFSDLARDGWTYQAMIAMSALSRVQPKRRPRGAWLPAALMLVADHPEWTDGKIAKSIGVHPGTLSRSVQYERGAQKARALGSGPKKGFRKRGREGGRDIEAEDESDSPADEADGDSSSQSDPSE